MNKARKIGEPFKGNRFVKDNAGWDNAGWDYHELRQYPDEWRVKS